MSTIYGCANYTLFQSMSISQGHSRPPRRNKMDSKIWLQVWTTHMAACQDQTAMYVATYDTLNHCFIKQHNLIQESDEESPRKYVIQSINCLSVNNSNFLWVELNGAVRSGRVILGSSSCHDTSLPYRTWFAREPTKAPNLQFLN